MYKDYIINCFKRAMFYQVLIIFAVLRLIDAYRLALDFISQLDDFFRSIKIKPRRMKYYRLDMEDFQKGVMIGIIIIASLSILGIGLFQFASGLICIMIAFVFYNPILEYQRQTVFKAYTDYLPSTEFIFFIVLGLGMMTNTFSYSSWEKKKETPEKEVKVEMADQSKRNETHSSDKKKKKVI